MVAIKPIMGDNHFIALVVVVQLAFFVIFGIWSSFHVDALPPRDAVARNLSVTPLSLQNGFTAKQPLFIDMNAALLAGFGFLVVFLRRYGFGSVSINLLLTAFTVEWALIIRGFLSEEFTRSGFFSIGINELICADFTVAVILISFGALVGKLSPVQYLLMALFETPVAILSEHLLLNVLQIADIGGSIWIHMFGAFFGITVSRMLFDSHWLEHEHDGSVYHSDLFSFIGTLFLWICFPSFNAARATTEDMRHRIVLGTYLSLVASTIYAFLFSPIFNKNRRFVIRDIAHGSLAGGVAIAAIAHTSTTPLCALLTGTFAGIIAVMGFRYATPKFAKSFKIHDSRGVYSLHALPGLFGALLSILSIFLHNANDYGDALPHIYPAMRLTPYDPRNPTLERRLVADSRGYGQQALMQLAALGLGILIPIVAGAIVGFIMRLRFWTHIRDNETFSDAQFFEVPEDFDFATRLTSRVNRIELAETTGMLNPAAEEVVVPTTAAGVPIGGGGL